MKSLSPCVGHLAVFVVGPARALYVPVPHRPGKGEGVKQASSEEWLVHFGIASASIPSRMICTRGPDHMCLSVG